MIIIIEDITWVHRYRKFLHFFLCNCSNGDLFKCEDIMFVLESSLGIPLLVIIKCNNNINNHNHNQNLTYNVC